MESWCDKSCLNAKCDICSIPYSFIHVRNSCLQKLSVVKLYSQCIYMHQRNYVRLDIRLMKFENYNRGKRRSTTCVFELHSSVRSTEINFVIDSNIRLFKPLSQSRLQSGVRRITMCINIENGELIYAQEWFITFVPD